MGERIEVSTAWDDIRNLFDQQFPEGDNPYEAYGRLAAFLAQVEADQERLDEALKVCRALVDGHTWVAMTMAIKLIPADRDDYNRIGVPFPADN